MLRHVAGAVDAEDDAPADGAAMALDVGASSLARHWSPARPGDGSPSSRASSPPASSAAEVVPARSGAEAAAPPRPSRGAPGGPASSRWAPPPPPASAAGWSLPWCPAHPAPAREPAPICGPGATSSVSEGGATGSGARSIITAAGGGSLMPSPCATSGPHRPRRRGSRGSGRRPAPSAPRQRPVVLVVMMRVGGRHWAAPAAGGAPAGAVAAAAVSRPTRPIFR